MDCTCEFHTCISAKDQYDSELPNSLVFDEIKEVESPEDDDLPTDFVRIEPKFLSESMLMARRSSYLGHTPSAPARPTNPCDRLRC